MIRGQFSCISKHLDWNIVFHKDYYASAEDDLAGNVEALEELREEGKNAR